MAQKITFTVAAEIVQNATSGILLGDFNNWNVEQGMTLKQEKDGSLKTTVALNSGTYQYRYFLSDGRWVNDANADNYMYSEGFFVDNCVITVPVEASKAVKAKNETPVTVVETVRVATKAVTKKVAVATAEPVIEKKATKAKKEVVEVVEAAPTKTKKGKK